MRAIYMDSEHDVLRWRVCRAEDIKSGQKLVVRLAGREIGIINCGGTFHALVNRCPHRGAPLCLGRIRPLVTAPKPGCFVYGKEAAVIRCPWHQWEFDVETGRALADPRLRVATFRTVVEDGFIHVLAAPHAAGITPYDH